MVVAHRGDSHAKRNEMKKLVLLFVAALALAACGNHKKTSYDEMGSNGLTTRTENLKTNLRTYVNRGIMMGQQYGTLQGVGWQSDSDRSDLQGICADRPAVNGYELCGIERGQKTNADGLPFADIRRDVVQHFRRGGLVTMTWTAPDPHGSDDQLKAWTAKVAQFLASLQDAYGIKAPVVLFICPLDGHSWYTRLSKSDYARLYQQTAGWLKDDEAVNVLLGYSATPADLQQHSVQMPDADIDVVNLTLMAEQSADTAAYARQLNTLLPLLAQTAQQANAVPALTTGIDGLPLCDYFSRLLMPAVSRQRLAYVLLGRNHGEPKQQHFCVPYPGCPNEKIQDFMNLYNHDGFIFLNHLNGLYLNHNEKRD